MVYMNVQINLWQNQFFNSLQDKNQSQFYRQLLRFVGLAGVWVVISVYAQYLTQTLQIRWRRWLTNEYLEEWLADGAYYRMQFTGTQTDNPDQRIALNFTQEGFEADFRYSLVRFRDNSADVGTGGGWRPQDNDSAAAAPSFA